MSKKIPYYEPRAEDIRAAAKQYGYKISWKLEKHLLMVTVRHDPAFNATELLDADIRRFHPKIWLSKFYKEITPVHKSSNRSIYIVADMWKILRNV